MEQKKNPSTAYRYKPLGQTYTLILQFADNTCDRTILSVIEWKRHKKFLEYTAEDTQTFIPLKRLKQFSIVTDKPGK